MRVSYHTHIKYLAREGLLSQSILQQIHRSNIHRWKSEPHKKYCDFGIAFNANHDHERIQSFARNQSAKRVYAAYVRLIRTVITFVHTIPQFHKVIKENSEKVIAVILRVKKHIGLKRTLRFFNLSLSTFRQWSLQSVAHCFASLTGACNRIFPNQLSRPQVTLLKELLSDPKFQYWPVASIALYALRNNILALSINTWYKYVHTFGLKRRSQPSRRKKNAFSIRAHKPHQIWHADITLFVTRDNVKHYIYLVVDNFSRKILSWLVADAVKTEYRRDTIVQAFSNVKENNPSITLITDGGPENNLKAFLRESLYPIQHRKALVDVHYSNSLIEAHNKIIKYNYLYRMDIPDREGLIKMLPLIVDDFNNRPHVSLYGLTPHEAEQNISLDKEQITLNIRQATHQRKVYNQLHQCNHCKN